MKIQRNTLLLALLAFGLASGIYIQQRLAAPNSPSAIRTAGTEPLFQFDEADVVQFTINRPDLSLSLEKRAAESTGDEIADLVAETAALGQPDWNLTAPEQIPASDGAVAFLLNLLATGDRRASFTIPNDGQPDGPTQQRLEEFGLAQPKAQVDVTLADGTTHKLLLGNSNFDNSGIYAVQDGDPSRGEIEIFLVDTSLEPALLRPLEEWRYTAELPDSSAATPNGTAASDAEQSDEFAPLDSGIELRPLPGEGEGEGEGETTETLPNTETLTE